MTLTLRTIVAFNQLRMDYIVKALPISGSGLRKVANSELRERNRTLLLIIIALIT